MEIFRIQIIWENTKASAQINSSYSNDDNDNKDDDDGSDDKS